MVHIKSFSNYVLYSPLCTDVWNRPVKRCGVVPLEKVSSVSHETSSNEYVSRDCIVLHSVFVPNKHI